MVPSGVRSPVSLGEAAVLAIAVSFPLGPRFSAGVGNVYLATGLTLAWLAGWTFFVFAGPRGGLSLATAPQKAVVAYAGYLLLQVLLHLSALLQEPAALLRSVQLIAYMGLFATVSSMHPSDRIVRALLLLSLVVLVVESAIAWIPSTKSFEGYFTGTFDHQHSSFAAYLLLMLCIVVAALSFKTSRTKTLGLLVLLGACIAGIALSLSRSAYVAVPVALLALVHRRWGSRGAITAALLICVVVGAFALFGPVNARDRAASLIELASGQRHDISFFTRIRMWEDALQALARTGFIGTGVYEFLYLDSYFVRALVETGPIGLILFVTAVVTILTWLWRQYERERDPTIRALALGLYGASVGLLFVLNLAADTFLIHRVMGLYWVMLGVLIAVRNRESVAEPPGTELDEPGDGRS